MTLRLRPWSRRPRHGSAVTHFECMKEKAIANDDWIARRFPV